MVAETFFVVVFEIIAIPPWEEILSFLVRERQSDSAVLHDEIEGRDYCMFQPLPLLDKVGRELVIDEFIASDLLNWDGPTLIL